MGNEVIPRRQSVPPMPKRFNEEDLAIILRATSCRNKAARHAAIRALGAEYWNSHTTSEGPEKSQFIDFDIEVIMQ